MTSDLGEKAKQYAVALGLKPDTAAFNVRVVAYLAGATAALEAARKAVCSCCATGEGVVPSGDPQRPYYHSVMVGRDHHEYECKALPIRSLTPTSPLTRKAEP